MIESYNNDELEVIVDHSLQVDLEASRAMEYASGTSNDDPMDNSENGDNDERWEDDLPMHVKVEEQSEPENQPHHK